MEEFTDDNFQKEVIEKSKEMPIVVDFWASWCGPCMMLGPLLDGISEKYEGKVVFGKLNTEENKEKSEEYGIVSLPTVKLFKDGKIVDEFVGVIPEDQIVEWVDNNL